MYEWNGLPWRKIERMVFKLQKRIYKAQRRGDVKAVHRLQRLLTKSRSAKYLAVRRVTQDNQGKRTAGVDGVKSLTPPQRLALAKQLNLNTEPKPVRRTWIPKPGSDEKRPLGIVTMQDRALQTLVKLALEPEWEAASRTATFRPGRSCHDAIDAITWRSTNNPATCSMQTSRNASTASTESDCWKTQHLSHLATPVRAWLQAGIMDGGELFPTEPFRKAVH
jgi:RNA-directed DNA polymerase